MGRRRGEVEKEVTDALRYVVNPFTKDEAARRRQVSCRVAAWLISQLRVVQQVRSSFAACESVDRLESAVLEVKMALLDTKQSAGARKER